MTHAKLSEVSQIKTYENNSKKVREMGVRNVNEVLRILSPLLLFDVQAMQAFSRDRTHLKFDTFSA
eukprot:UN24745